MKLGAIIKPNFSKALSSLAKQPLPLKSGLKVRSLISTINDKVNTFDEARKNVLEQLGDRNERGELVIGDKGEVKISQDKMKLFAQELNSLLDQEVEIPQLSVEELGDKAMLTVEELIALGELLKE